ncbi:MAG: DUF5683 domain-containing protein [Bacteroidota bacterium]
MVHRLFVSILLVLLFQGLRAQPPPVSLRSSLLYSIGSEFLEAPPESLASVSSRSPALAIVLSALAPGAGQIYAERYWTIPLIWGFGYWFVRNYIQLDRKYDEWSATYTLSLQQGIFAGTGDPSVKGLRDFYHNERDRFAFYLALTYILNIVDAYVGASLYAFDVSEDLGGEQNVRAELRIPIR